MFSKATPEQTDYLLMLRGIAVIGVMLGHAFGIGQYSLGVLISQSHTWHFTLGNQHKNAVLDALFVLVSLLGTNFVILFFVQSGYLMGKIFHDQRYDISWAGILTFYKNRYMRLAPLLYFNLLICASIFVGSSLSLEKVLGDIFFVTNFTGRSINLVTWSLSYEMQYYLIAPLIYFAFGRTISYRNAVLCILLFVIVYFAPSFVRLARHFVFMYAFIAGYSVNLFIRMFPIRVSEFTKILAVMIGGLLVNLVYNWCYFVGSPNIGALMCTLISAIAIYIVECPCEFKLSGRYAVYRRFCGALMLTGTISYGLYLWHYPIIVARHGMFSAWTQMAARYLGLDLQWQKVVLFHLLQLSFVVPVSFAIALATFSLIERRFRPGLYKPGSVPTYKPGSVPA